MGNANKFACSAGALPSTTLGNLTSCDSFIINHSHDEITKEKDNQMDIDALDTRRIVFVSVTGLYQSWKECPSSVLYTALLLMPLKRQWIYKPWRHKDRLSILGDINDTETVQFLRLLKWKDSQGLCCWMLDQEYTNEMSLIHPIWLHLNDTLQRLHDPITCAKYQCIPLDDKWWQSDNYISEYEVQSPAIVHEICEPSLKYSVLQEMVFQSNPTSLVPVMKYSAKNKRDTKCKWHKENMSLSESAKETWCVSDDYLYQLYDVTH
eukprot:117470_1